MRCNSCSKVKYPHKALPFLALCSGTNYAKMHGGQIFILDIGEIGADIKTLMYGASLPLMG
jgi:hypothetical protein